MMMLSAGRLPRLAAGARFLSSSAGSLAATTSPVEQEAGSLAAASSPVEQEAQLREELAAAHLLQVHYGLDDLVWNHLSARCPWSPEHFLVTPGNKLFSEVEPDDLVVVDTVADKGSANVTANVIHAAFYEARRDVGAVVHNHSRSCMGVACLAGESLRYLTQDAAGFYGQVGYHSWEGLSDNEDEKASLGRDLGDSHTLVMRNHGVAVVGASIGEAWVRNYFLDRICQVQMDLLPALAAEAAKDELGGDLVSQPSAMVLQHAASQMHRDFQHGRFEWEAMLRWYRREKGESNKAAAPHVALAAAAPAPAPSESSTPP